MRLVEQVHRLLGQHLRPGDRTIDATAGNGYDTVALARLVGEGGGVLAIDVQAAAVENTRKRLEEAHLSARAELHTGCHAAILNRWAKEQTGRIHAIVFNLGYLPGSDRTVLTRSTTTLQALDAAAVLLRPGGLLTVATYRGHPGGAEEAGATEGWMRGAIAQDWRVERHETGTPASTASPVLWAAWKPV